jgi:hypothetical protein
MVGVLLNQQRGDASVTINGAQDSEDLFHDQRGKTKRWLVEQQEFRPQQWGRAHCSCNCDLDSEAMRKLFDLHFFCRGNSILFHHLILAQKNVGLHLFAKAQERARFRNFVPKLLSRVIIG